MAVFLDLLVVITLCASVNGQPYDPCAGQLDGTIPHFDCTSYVVCNRGYPRTVNCPPGQVFERVSFRCISVGTGYTDCGLPGNDCSGKPDKMYTDESYGCQTFYHCASGGFVSPRIYCDTSTVFDFKKQYCEHIAAVAPPCGTGGIPPPPPTTTTTARPQGDTYCIGRPDGTKVPFNCNTYRECLGGYAQLKNCPKGYVFERASGACKRIGDGDTDCGFPVFDCYGETDIIKTDDRYDCQTYYHCKNNVFVAPRQYCDYNMVFNVATQSCDFPYNVPAPCGTRPY